jgi:hypothetical protein
MMGDKNANYMKEYPLDSMKESRIASRRTDFNIRLTSDGKTAVNI